MISDLDAAKLCLAAYTGKSAGWEKWLDVGGVVAGIKKVADITIVAFRGSDSCEDWLRDLDEVPEEHPDLGYVHSGFLEGMDAFYGVLRPLLKGDIYLVGHSLGAAHACILAGLMAEHPPKRLSLFGCPRPGFEELRKLVMKSWPMITSYRNRDDPVTEVPYLLGLYEHIIEPTRLFSPTNPLNPASEHSIYLYIEALQK